MSEITDVIHSEIVALFTPEKVTKVLRFFKTSKESYGEHDKFAAKMPSIMLSYALEHLDPVQKKFYRAKRSQIS
ncbi:MAG: hypothetical protein LBJ89_00245 [Holosporales bacterium]|jgi:hypothetical protein|nr:hypothetical protein [Holosporales bacterium]